MDPGSPDGASTGEPEVKKKYVPKFGVPMGGFMPILPKSKQRAPSIEDETPPAGASSASSSSAPEAKAPEPAQQRAASPPSHAIPPAQPTAGQFTAVPGGRAGAPPPRQQQQMPPALPPQTQAQQHAQPLSQPPPQPQQQRGPPPLSAQQASPPQQPQQQQQQQQQQRPLGAAPPSLPPHASFPPSAAAPPVAVSSASASLPVPPPQTEQEVEVARSMLAFLLEEISPSVFTKKKDALATFEMYYFKIFPAYTIPEIRRMYYGSTPSTPQEKAKGIFALCGATSWKHSGLKKAAALALGLLAKLCDKEASPHAQHFMQLFIQQDAHTLRLLRFDKHLASPRGNRHAASYLLGMLKIFKHDTYEAVQRDLVTQAPEEAQHLKTLQRDVLAKRVSMRGDDLTGAGGVMRKKSAYAPTEATAGNRSGAASPRGPNSNSSAGGASGASGGSNPKSGIKHRLLVFFGARPSVQELEKKGIMRAKSFGVPLDDLYRTPALLDTVQTSFDGPVQVPTVMKMACVHMELTGIIELQGVFRLSGDSIEIASTKEKFDNGIPVDLTKVGPHSVSGLVKLFLRNLPQPLLLFENYDELVGAFRAGDMMKIQTIIAGLPKAHHSTYLYLMDFLAKVNRYAETNMMTELNIAICIAPNILRPKVETYEKVAKDTPVTIGVVKYLIATHAERMRQANLLPGMQQQQQQQQGAPIASSATPADMPGQAMPSGQTVPAAAAASPPATVAAAAGSPPPRFAISPPVSPRGGRAVMEQYSSTSAEAVAEQKAAAAAAAAAAIAAGEEPPVEEKATFVPTAAQFDLANAMANAIANRGALKSRGPPPIGSAAAGAATSSSSSASTAPIVQLKKVTPGAGGPPPISSASAGAPPPGRAGLKPVDPAKARRPSMNAAGGVVAGGPVKARRPSINAGGLGVGGHTNPQLAAMAAKKRVSVNLGAGGIGGIGGVVGGASSSSSSSSSSSGGIPEHFERFQDPATGKYYYFNRLTQKVTWRKPDAVVDALDEKDARQVFPPPVPSEAPPAEEDEDDEKKANGGSGGADGSSVDPLQVPIHAPMDPSPVHAGVTALPAILPKPPSQPRRTSSMFLGQTSLLQSPPPIPTPELSHQATHRQSTVTEEEEDEDGAAGGGADHDDDDDDDFDIPVPTFIPAIPTTLPPPYDDGDDDDVPLPPQPIAAAPVAEVEAEAAPAAAEAPVVEAEEPQAALAGAPALPPMPSAAASSVVADEPAVAPVALEATSSLVVAPSASSAPSAVAPASVVVADPTPNDDHEVEEDVEWEEYTDAVSGKAYFYNKRTDKTTWKNPFKAAEKEKAAAAAAAAAIKAAAAKDATTVVADDASPVGPAVAATYDHSSSSFPSPLYGGWNCVSIHGRWDAHSAQGCYPNFSGWSRNPQYHVGIGDGDVFTEVKGKTQVVIQLQWSNLTRVNGVVADTDSLGHIAGFYVLINHGPSYQKLFINADDIVSRSEFEKDGSVLVNLLLESWATQKPGKADHAFVKNYLIIPSTFEPGFIGDFTLTVHAASPTWLQPVDPKEMWRETSVTSQWLGDTAGGCRNHATTFPSNPQFTLVSSIKDRTTPVLCVLTQQAEAGVTHPIGWYAINQSGKIEAKGAFQANVEVHNQFEYQVESAPYVLVPCTFAPGLEAKFTLAVFAPPAAKLTLTANPRT